MVFAQIERKILADGVIRFYYQLPSASFLYFGFFLESLEGICSYTTPPHNKNIMQVDVVPHYLAEYQNLISTIKKMAV